MIEFMGFDLDNLLTLAGAALLLWGEHRALSSTLKARLDGIAQDVLLIRTQLKLVEDRATNLADRAHQRIDDHIARRRPGDSS